MKDCESSAALIPAFPLRAETSNPAHNVWDSAGVSSTWENKCTSSLTRALCGMAAMGLASDVLRTTHGRVRISSRRAT